MQKGRDFLKAQVNNAIMQHKTLFENVEDHVKQADDPRYRALCEKYLPKMREHQQALEAYGTSIGSEGPGSLKKAVGAALGKARDAVDAMRETDFLRLVGDIVTIRQAQDTFATFAAAGQELGETRLVELGRSGEKVHDEMQREFNDLVAKMFVDHVRDTGASASKSARPEVR